jgi:hypothetical protein
MTDNHRDGNALAGPLSDVFAVEVTTAVVQCAECGRRDVVANLMAYAGELGAVLRCPSCEAVVLRYAATPHGQWLDLRGSARLQFPA